MRVLQVLPELNSGGVERGTVDFARYLVQQGHQSLVMSAGGRLEAQLAAEGSEHIPFPVHRKSLKSLLQVSALRKQLLELNVDVIHVRSRVPAWMVWLALKKIPPSQRPVLISTFHGLYSTNAYSAIMGCGDQVIAISECVRDYILQHYPKVAADKINLIHRGVDIEQFNPQHQLPQQWTTDFFNANPQLADKHLILMPGRLSRWKGQVEFIDTIGDLIAKSNHCHGIILGSPTPGKEHYLQELQTQVKDKGLQQHITFLAHTDQIANLYKLSKVVCNLSQHPEPFGRTVIESLAMGTPVVSYDYGGPAESLRDCYPRGLVPVNDKDALVLAIEAAISDTQPIVLPEQFTLDYQARATLDVYQKALSERR